MSQRDRDRAQPTAPEPDFATEHTHSTFSGEQRSTPGMEPDESVPHGTSGNGGMDIGKAHRRHESGLLATGRRVLRAARRNWRRTLGASGSRAQS
jgi:hypothetical protein